MVWQFDVKPGKQGEFEAFYGADGAWTRLEPGPDGPRDVQRELPERHLARAAEHLAAAAG